jgi:hypothetical protein
VKDNMVHSPAGLRHCPKPRDICHACNLATVVFPCVKKKGQAVVVREKVKGGRRIGKVRGGRDLQDLHLPSSKVGIGENSDSQIHLAIFLSLGKLE